MGESQAAVLKPLLSQHLKQGLGGELAFVDTLFSFIRTHTKLLQSPTAIQQIQQIALKHVELAKKQQQQPKGQSATIQNTVDKDNNASSTSTATSSIPLASSEESKSKSAAEVPSVVESKPKQPAPVGNGGKTEVYTWTQSLAEVTVVYELPANITAKQLSVNIEPNHLTVINRADDNTLTDGSLHDSVHSDDATWTLESNRSNKLLTIFLPKVNRMSWWKCVVKGEAEIDTTLIQPENSQLSDLDVETRKTVEKMMFDQRMKAAGRPTSDESQKQEMLKKFMEQHPEMDFSQAKIM